MWTRGTQCTLTPALPGQGPSCWVSLLPQQEDSGASRCGVATARRKPVPRHRVLQVHHPREGADAVKQICRVAVTHEAGNPINPSSPR